MNKLPINGETHKQILAAIEKRELAAADGTWTPEELAAFLEKPRDFAKGTKMSFAGLRKEEERADVIAYLAQFNMEGSGGS